MYMRTAKANVLYHLVSPCWSAVEAGSNLVKLAYSNAYWLLKANGSARTFVAVSSSSANLLSLQFLVQTCVSGLGPDIKGVISYSIPTILVILALKGHDPGDCACLCCPTSFWRGIITIYKSATRLLLRLEARVWEPLIIIVSTS